MSCAHLNSGRRLIMTCCGRAAACTLCHACPDARAPGAMQCAACQRTQPEAAQCVGCGARASYFCAKCHIADLRARPDVDMYHCDECGVCRAGPRVPHCARCGWCAPPGHKCAKADVAHTACVVCVEPLDAPLGAAGGAALLQPCGHALHEGCAARACDAGASACPECRAPWA